jgi:hypothetical protein
MFLNEKIVYEIDLFGEIFINGVFLIFLAFLNYLKLSVNFGMDYK